MNAESLQVLLNENTKKLKGTKQKGEGKGYEGLEMLSANVVRKATQEGGTLTFGDTMFSWIDLDAAAGAYVVGFVVEDLDGNRREVFGQVTVE